MYYNICQCRYLELVLESDAGPGRSAEVIVLGMARLISNGLLVTHGTHEQVQ